MSEIICCGAQKANQKCMEAVVIWERYPQADKRFVWGDDYAGDAWIHPKSMKIHWCAVGHGPPDFDFAWDERIGQWVSWRDFPENAQHAWRQS